MTKKEFQKYWDKASRNPFRLIELPSGKYMIAGGRDVFVVYDLIEKRMQAVTRDKEFFGGDSRIIGNLYGDPRKWGVESMRNPGKNYTYKTISEVRDAFWEYSIPPKYKTEYRPGKRQNEYSADIRMMFVGFVDDLARSGDISEALAQRVTL